MNDRVTQLAVSRPVLSTSVPGKALNDARSDIYETLDERCGDLLVQRLSSEPPGAAEDGINRESSKAFDHGDGLRSSDLRSFSDEWVCDNHWYTDADDPRLPWEAQLRQLRLAS